MIHQLKSVSLTQDQWRTILDALESDKEKWYQHSMDGTYNTIIEEIQKQRLSQ